MRLKKFSEQPFPASNAERGDWPLAGIYHENSKLTEETARLLGEKVAEWGDEPVNLERQSLAFKAYPTAPRTPLEPSTRVRRNSVEDTLRRRRTRRGFTGGPISTSQVSRLLHFGCGITAEMNPNGDSGISLKVRSYPSAGGLYPLEVYPVVTNVEGFEPALYHYNAWEHSLKTHRRGGFLDELRRLILTEGYLEGTALTIIITAMLERTLAKYGERGYRFILLEAGHMAQNFLLEAEFLGLGAVPFGGFLDDELAAFLEVDAETEPPLYVLGFGHPAE